MTTDHGEPGGETTVRDRNAGEGRGRDGRRQPGNDLVCDAGFFERKGLLAAAPEDEWVAALEADDALTALRGANQQTMNTLLIDRVAIGALADIETLCLRREVQELLGRQRVEQDEVGTTEPIDGTHGEELGIAGTGADERNEAAHDAASTFV